jgi:hypothetical protein
MHALIAGPLALIAAASGVAVSRSSDAPVANGDQRVVPDHSYVRVNGDPSRIALLTFQRIMTFDKGTATVSSRGRTYVLFRLPGAGDWLVTDPKNGQSTRFHVDPGATKTISAP